MKKNKNTLTRITSAKYYEWLMSLIGATIIAFALGTLLARAFVGYAPLLLLIGVAMHGWAMFVIHQRNK